MEEEIKKTVSAYYTHRMQQFGPTPSGVDWNSQESQIMRFDQLIKILPDDASIPFSIIDYGCGYGALYHFLKKGRPKFTYAGYDISSEMIRQGSKINAGENLKFCNSDEELVESDFIVASGIFNVKVDIDEKKWLAYIIETLHTMDRLAKIGLSFNLLSRYSDVTHRKSNLYYADPGFLFDYCKNNFSKRVSLIHDYPLFEFTILVRK